MIYTGLNRTGEIVDVKAHGSGDISEVYGGIGEMNPIYYKSRTITGTLPLSYKALGKPLSDYLIEGNTIQSGTPTSEAPVDVIGCGVRTENLFDKDDQTCYFANTSLGQNNKWVATNSGVVLRIPCAPSTSYTISLRGEYAYNVWNIELTSSDDVPTAGNNIQTVAMTSIKPKNLRTTITTMSDTKYILLQFISIYINSGGNANIMLNLGSTALPYEPYGYKLPLTINGTEYPIYLGRVEATRRIRKLVLTGTETTNTITVLDQLLFQFNGVYTIEKIYGNAHDTLLCNGYKIVNGRTTAASDENNYSMTTYNSVNDNRLLVHDDRFTTVDEFKAWLAAQYANGNPVTIWYVLAEPETGIVNEPLHKIGNYADTISMTQASITIPTTAGTNILAIPTTVPPSSISINGNIKPESY